MGALLEAGLPWDAVRSLTPERAAHVLEGMAGVRAARARRTAEQA